MELPTDLKNLEKSDREKLWSGQIREFYFSAKSQEKSGIFFKMLIAITICYYSC